MLRRSLILFVLLVLAGLAATAGYAVLKLRGPAEVLAEAENMLRTGRAGGANEAIALLDLCETSMSAEPRRHEQLLRLRLMAHQRLNNHRRALDDIEILLRDGRSDPDLQLQRIYYLAALRNGERARKEALEFLAGNPDSAWGHELAGDAAWVVYERQLSALTERLRSELGADREQAGIDAFLEYLYREDGDPRRDEALADLQRLHGHEPRFVQAWPALLDRMRSLRLLVQEACQHFRRALELATPQDGNFFASSYRGVTRALQHADRRDDLVAQSELYLTRYDHRYAIEAATEAATAHLDDGLHEAAIATAERFLPAGSIEARLEAGKLDLRLQDLLAVKALALYHLGRRDDLLALSQQLHEIGRAGLRMDLPPPLSAGLAGALVNETNEHIEGRLHSVVRHLLRRKEVPGSGADPLDLVAPLLLDALRRRGAEGTELVKVVEEWAKYRPRDLDPLRHQARVLLEVGRTNAAMSAAQEVLDRDPRDEATLRLLARAADLGFAASGQDGAQLLVQCLQRGRLRPDAPHPVVLLTCGEAALQQGHALIARECARAAGDSFPRARWPRLLEARAELQLGDAGAAAAVLQAALENWPDDREALELWFRAAAAAGRPRERFLPAAVRAGLDTLPVATALLRAGAARRSPFAPAHARAAARREDADAELLGLAARVLAAAGDVAAARPLLDRAHELLDASPQAAPTVAAATIEFLRALAPATADDELCTLASRELQRVPPRDPASAALLLAAAQRLERSGHVRTGHLLAETALALDAAADLRDGRSFGLAGRLALARGDLELAAARWTAAVTFPEGQPAAEPLARLELRRGRPERLRRAFGLAAAPTDPALALLAGERAAAARIARARLLEDGSDLLAAIAATLCAEEPDPAAPGAGLAAAAPALRRAALELLALLGDPVHAPAALPRARELAAALPDSAAARLLLARALTDSGDGAGAASLHEELTTAGPADAGPAGGELPLVLLGEAARSALRAPGYRIPARVRTELRQRAVAAADSFPPRLLAATLREVAAEAIGRGDVVVAAKVLADLWTRHPGPSGATVADAARLFALQRAGDALLLLGQLRQLGSTEERLVATTAIFLSGLEHREALTPANLAALRREALDVLANGELRGPPLVFLRAFDEQVPDLADGVLRRCLTELLDRCGRGLESWRFVAEAVALAERRLGVHATLDLLEDAIAAAPGLTPLWISRARLLVAVRRGDEGLEAARGALSFVDAPELTLDFLALAAEQRSLRPADLQRLEQLPAGLRETERGRYVGGLVALRRGRPDEAEALLAGAAPQPSGWHLYARALANLERRAPEARALARSLFQELEERYPSSSLARYAGSFARQLAPD